MGGEMDAGGGGSRGRFQFSPNFSIKIGCAWFIVRAGAFCGRFD